MSDPTVVALVPDIVPKIKKKIGTKTTNNKGRDSTPALSDTIRINPSIAKDVTKHVDGYTITYTYKYDGYTFHVDAEVDAVQTHNAKDAIKSAWGVDVNVSDDETTMSLQ